MQQHADAMDPAAQGKYVGSVNGQHAKKAGTRGSRTLTDPVEKFAKPLLHLDTPASAVWVTPASISLFSGQDTSITTQGDAHLASGHTLSSVSGQTTSLYTHAGGIKAITANADLSVRAHTDAMQIWADKDITVQSTTDEIRIYAKDSIALNAGQSQILLKGADITFTMPGQFTVKGSAHEWSSGASGAASLPDLPEGAVSVPATTPIAVFSPEPEKYSERLAVFNPLTGEAQPIKYALINKTAVVEKGKSGGDGLAARFIKPDPEPMKALVGSSAAWAVEYHAGEQRPIRIEPGDDPTMNLEDGQHV
jgi:type VI secretion system secreted protein VgrG